MCQTIRQGVAFLCGLAVWCILMLLCVHTATTPGDRLRVLLGISSLPLSVLTIWLVNSLLKWLLADPSSSPNNELSEESIYQERLGISIEIKIRKKNSQHNDIIRKDF